MSIAIEELSYVKCGQGTSRSPRRFGEPDLVRPNSHNWGNNASFADCLIYSRYVTANALFADRSIYTRYLTANALFADHLIYSRYLTANTSFADRSILDIRQQIFDS